MTDKSNEGERTEQTILLYTCRDLHNVKVKRQIGGSAPKNGKRAKLSLPVPDNFLLGESVKQPRHRCPEPSSANELPESHGGVASATQA